MKNLITIISLVLLFTFTSLLLFTPLTCNAGVWGEAMASQVMTNLWTYIQKNILSMTMAVLKKTAVQMITSTVNNIIAGQGTEGALYITNYKAFLTRNTSEASAVMLNDMINITFNGRTSGSTYSTSSGSAASGNYSSNLRSSVIGVIFGNDPRSNITDFVDHPKNMFATGNMRAANSYFLNSDFNKLEQFTAYSRKTTEKLEKEAETKAIANSGFKSVEDKNGNIKYPGASIKSMLDNANDLGNKMLANAQGPFEVITGVVAKLLVSQVRKGLGNVQNSIQKEVTSTLGKFKQEAANSISPNNVYKPSY